MLVDASQSSVVAPLLSISIPCIPLTNQKGASSSTYAQPHTRRTMTQVIDSLRQQIASHEASLRDLRQQLAEAEHNQHQQEKVLRQKPKLSNDPLDHDMNFGVPDDFRSEVFAILDQDPPAAGDSTDGTGRWPLEANEYKRYGRQLIMAEIGLQGQFACADCGKESGTNVRANRAAQIAESQGIACRHGWSWVPCCSLPSRSRSGHPWPHRRRYRRGIQFASSNPPFDGKSRDDES